MAVGSIVATLTLDIPAGLQAYPGWFTVRFLMAALVSYAGFFALSSGTTRTALLVVGGFVALVIGGEAAGGPGRAWRSSSLGW